jgi:acetyltransferase-like isoleucine patch superfamily enzyme
MKRDNSNVRSHGAVLLSAKDALMVLRTWICCNFVGMDIGRCTRISLRARLDLTNPRGVHIGDGTCIDSYASIMASESSGRFHTYIGRNCYIGARAIILPGVRVGDQSIVLPGSVVSKEVPRGTMVVGHPARVLRSGLRTARHGLILEESTNAAQALEALGEVPSNEGGDARPAGAHI